MAVPTPRSQRPFLTTSTLPPNNFDRFLLPDFVKPHLSYPLSKLQTIFQSNAFFILIMASSVFSATLQSITTAKLDELSKKRRLFEENKATLLAVIEHESDQMIRLRNLLAGVRTCFAVKAALRVRVSRTAMHDVKFMLSIRYYSPKTDRSDRSGVVNRQMMATAGFTILTDSILKRCLRISIIFSTWHALIRSFPPNC